MTNPPTSLNPFFHKAHSFRMGHRNKAQDHARLNPFFHKAHSFRAGTKGR